MKNYTFKKQVSEESFETNETDDFANFLPKLDHSKSNSNIRLKKTIDRSKYELLPKFSRTTRIPLGGSRQGNFLFITCHFPTQQ